MVAGCWIFSKTDSLPFIQLITQDFSSLKPRSKVSTCHFTCVLFEVKNSKPIKSFNRCFCTFWNVNICTVISFYRIWFERTLQWNRMAWSRRPPQRKICKGNGDCLKGRRNVFKHGEERSFQTILSSPAAWWSENYYEKKVHPKLFQNPFLGCPWVVSLVGIKTWSAIEYFYLIKFFWENY